MCRLLPDNQPTISTLNFSYTPKSFFIWMSTVCVVIAGVKVCVVEGLAKVVGFASGNDVIVSSSAFFPSLAASLRVANIGPDSFGNERIASIIILGNAESLSSSCFVDHFHQFHLKMIHD
jgi:hypothetical protein